MRRPAAPSGSGGPGPLMSAAVRSTRVTSSRKRFRMKRPTPWPASSRCPPEARSEAIPREISGSGIAPRHPRPRSARVVLVVAPPPDARLVTPPGRAVEPLVHAPEAVHSARVTGIGVAEGAVLERERAHAGPLPRVGSLVGSAHGREGDSPLAASFLLPWALAPVVVLDALALLLRGEPDGEVRVEVAAERGRPGERPAHPLLVRLQLGERRPRHGPEHHVMVGQVH